MKSSLCSDPLPAELRNALGVIRDDVHPLARRIFYLNETASTNDIALSLAAEDEAEGTLVIADRQTAGRGRLGRVWHSPPGAGLYISMVLRPGRAGAGDDRATGLLTLAAGVALAEAVDEVTGLGVDIKWPNDLLVGRRKLAGILAESVAGDLGQIVLGYGINVGAAALPDPVAARATSLESELGRAVDRAALAAATIVAISRRYADLLNGRFDAILDAWRARSTSSRGARVSWDTPAGRQVGETQGIDNRGALLVRVGDRTERIVGGEVTWI